MRLILKVLRYLYQMYWGWWYDCVTEWQPTIYDITVTSYWARWHLKLPASPLFTQPSVHAPDQRKHRSSAPLDFVEGIHWTPVNSHHKGHVKRKWLHLMTSSWHSCDQISVPPLCVWERNTDVSYLFEFHKTNIAWQGEQVLGEDDLTWRFTSMIFHDIQV